MTTKQFFIGVTVLLVLVLLTGPLRAQEQVCGPRDRIVEILMRDHQESRQSIGLGQNNVVFETFASVETGTWTIIVTNPYGVTCLVASGGAFENLAGGSPPQGEQL